MKLHKWYWLMLLLFPLVGWSQQTNDEMVFVLVEEPPEFIGGKDSLISYIKYHLKYPAAALEAKKTGKVLAKFIIEPDGQVTNAEIIWSLGFGCEQEVLRVIAGFPKWKPGRQSGKAIRVAYICPFYFQRTD